ncbi:hypothetical protein Tco_1396843 [Tanacetum coccineum]
MYEECGRQTFGCFRDTAAECAEDTTRSTYLVNRSPSSAIGFKKPVDMLGNMGFNESGEYKKTFIGSSVGTSSIQVLQGDEFDVEPQEPHGNVDHVVGSQDVQTQDLIYYHLARDREQHSENNNEAAFVVATVEKIYAHESLTFNNTIAYEVISKWKAGLKDDMDA